MAKLSFSDDKHREQALNINENNMNVCSSVDAFFILINGLDYESLSVLCDKIYDEFVLMYGNDYITKEQCYEMTQNLEISLNIKEMIVNIAYKCINDGLYLGTKMSSGFNTSAWINHSYYVSECCSNLAWMMGLDPDKARSYGLLHDYGRKIDFKFDHVIYGFEKLCDLGHSDSAVACLTHSFLNGGRCANNERAVPGFYVSPSGEPKWMEGTSFDDITLFLENYQYNDYDILLNIADLMAIDKGIVCPYDRILDIATRREIDPINRGYFLASLTNTLIDILKRLNLIDKSISYIMASEGVSLSDIEERFLYISKYFYDVYEKFSKEQTMKKNK